MYLNGMIRCRVWQICHRIRSFLIPFYSSLPQYLYRFGAGADSVSAILRRNKPVNQLFVSF